MTLWEEELPPPREVLLDQARRADGLISLHTDLNPSTQHLIGPRALARAVSAESHEPFA